MRPKTRKAGAATAPTLTIVHNSSVATDTASALRLQRLKLLGIIGRRADLLASLAWEVAHG